MQKKYLALQKKCELLSNSAIVSSTLPREECRWYSYSTRDSAGDSDDDSSNGRNASMACSTSRSNTTNPNTTDFHSTTGLDSSTTSFRNTTDYPSTMSCSHTASLP